MEKIPSYFSFVILLLAVTLVACSGGVKLEPPVPASPSISLEIKGNECPSLEVQAGIQITWTNSDTVDHVLVLERKDENGASIASGGTDLLQPGDTFSITLIDPGQYTYYCTENQTASGTITVLP